MHVQNICQLLFNNRRSHVTLFPLCFSDSAGVAKFYSIIIFHPSNKCISEDVGGRTYGMDETEGEMSVLLRVEKI